MIGEKGQQFNLRTTTGNRCHKQVGNRKRIFEECVCACGTVRLVSRENLMSGGSKDCGCTRKEKCKRLCALTKKHGFSRDRFYKIYYGLLNRCNSEKSPAYKYYGGKGIECERKSFIEFKNDMYESYIEHCMIYGEEETTIDRIDNNKNYNKDNCKRSTNLEQNNNKTNIKSIDYNGKTYSSIAELCRNLGLVYTKVLQRLQAGKTIDDAVK